MAITLNPDQALLIRDVIASLKFSGKSAAAKKLQEFFLRLNLSSREFTITSIRALPEQNGNRALALLDIEFSDGLFDFKLLTYGNSNISPFDVQRVTMLFTNKADIASDFVDDARFSSAPGMFLEGTRKSITFHPTSQEKVFAYLAYNFN